MNLERKREVEVIPQYSLTGDLLSYMRCGLQYRYHSGSQLPPSRPVQLWFGEFVHGVLESAFRTWKASSPSFPWPCNPTQYRQQAPVGRLSHDIGTIGDVVEGTLRARGKIPRSADTRDSAYRRAERAVNEIGPDLFPLVDSAEEPVIGTRSLPAAMGNALPARAKRYELHGIVDVLTSMTLSASVGTNVIRDAIRAACPSLAGQYEVIVDYKASRRPPTNSPYWDHGDWQLQTYAWLRTRQPQAKAVAAGVLIYINELEPVGGDIDDLKREIRAGLTDIVPMNGTPDSYALNTWRTGNAVPQLTRDFRLARAIRVIPINSASQAIATRRFDQTVLDIEQHVSAEAAAGTIVANWNACGDKDTCAACDFRYFCPSPAPRTAGYIPGAPPAP